MLPGAYFSCEPLARVNDLNVALHSFASIHIPFVLYIVV